MPTFANDLNLSHDTTENGQSRHLALTGIASGRARAQYALEAVRASAKSAVNRSDQADAQKGRD